MLFDLWMWNLALCATLLWNLCDKKDKLWVRWVHVQYMKGEHALEYQHSSSVSWILKALFRIRENVMQTDTWKGLARGEN